MSFRFNEIFIHLFYRIIRKFVSRELIEKFSVSVEIKHLLTLRTSRQQQVSEVNWPESELNLYLPIYQWLLCDSIDHQSVNVGKTLKIQWLVNKLIVGKKLIKHVKSLTIKYINLFISKWLHFIYLWGLLNCGWWVKLKDSLIPTIAEYFSMSHLIIHK